MATGDQIMELVLYDLLEDSSLSLGIITDAQVLNMLNMTLIDLFRETCPYSVIFTETVAAGVSQHSVPTGMMRVDDCFLAGKILEPSTILSLNAKEKGWRYTQSAPRRWHADGLPQKTIELAPVPDDNSEFIPGTAEPAPPHGQFGEFSAVDGSSVTMTPEQHRGLTMVGPQAPTVIQLLDDPILYLDDEIAMTALGYGILERIFSGDSELKDPQRALWCKAQYEELVAVLKSASGEL